MLYWDASIKDVKDYCLVGNDIICIGAGKALLAFLECLSEYELLYKVKAIVDNDVNKQGRFVYYNNEKICKIISFELFLKLNLNKVVIIITTDYLDEIISWLSENKGFGLIPIVYYGFVLENIMEDKIAKTEQEMLRIPKGEECIPRIIHYCWFGKNEIPDQHRKWMETWKEMCPDYKVYRWDESNYDVHKIPYISEAYIKGKYGFVSDYARLDILYQYGGVYLDTDVEIMRPLDRLLCQNAFIGTEFPSNMVNTGSGVGAKKKLKIIKYLMEDYEKRHFIKKNGEVDLTTCVIIQTHALSALGFKTNGERQTIKELEIYPSMLFSPFLPYSRRVVNNSMSYMCHHFAGSWLENNVASRMGKITNIYKMFSKDF